MVPKVEAVEVIVASGMVLDRDAVDDVDAEDFGTRDRGAREDELDVPARKAQRPRSRGARVGHREGQAIARLGDRHGVLVEVTILERRGDGRGKEVGRTSRTRRPSECAGKGVSLTDGDLIGAAHRVLNLPRLEGGGGA